MTSGELAASVEALATALDRLRRAVVPDVVWHATDEDVLATCRAVSGLRARTEAAYLSLVAEVDRRRAAAGVSTSSGGRASVGTTTEGVLRTAALVSAGQARRDVAAAHALHGRSTDRGTTVAAVLPLLAEQLGTGGITREHVDVAVRCLDRVPRHLTGMDRTGNDDHDDDGRTGSDDGGSPVTSEQLGTTVRDVVVAFVSEVAGTGTARDLDRACRQVLDRIDPDGGDRYDPAAYERRYLDMSTDSTGMLLGRFQLDAAAGLALRAAVEAHSAPAPSEDGLRDPRSARQRRADALVRVAETARGVSSPVRGEPPRVVVHVSPAQLVDDAVRGAGRPRRAVGAVASTSGPGEAGRTGPWLGAAAWTESGERVDRATARRLSCDAVLQRVVTAGSAGLLELGREVRLATRTQRRVLAVRDRGCVVPGCGAPPEGCDAHHVRHWADGGPTDLGNLVLLCPSHHTAVHTGTWSVALAQDGVPEVVPPRWVDPDRRPRRLWHHHVEAAAVRAAGSGDPAGGSFRRVGPGSAVGAGTISAGTTAAATTAAAGTIDTGTIGVQAPGRAPTRPGTTRPSRSTARHDGTGGMAVVVTLPVSRQPGPTATAREDVTVTPLERHLVALLDTG